MVFTPAALHLAALVCLLLSPACAEPMAADRPAAEFEGWWRDGKAELDGYHLTVQRYGEPRGGQAVMIFVTEPFSASRRVKLDDPAARPDDTVDVLKLNFVRDFQTGVYDYNTMLSYFVSTEGFQPLKASFSSAEWCGHVYEELIFRPGEIDQRLSSYFDHESIEQTIARPAQAVDADGLLILLRGLDGDFLRAGEVRQVSLLNGVLNRRLTHTAAVWSDATIERQREVEEVTVPAGRYPTLVYRVAVSGGPEGRFHIEQAYPHRVVKWSWRDRSGKLAEGADEGELTGSARLPYWELHAGGHERHLDQLGLKPQAR